MLFFIRFLTFKLSVFSDQLVHLEFYLGRLVNFTPYFWKLFHSDVYFLSGGILGYSKPYDGDSSPIRTNYVDCSAYFPRIFSFWYPLGVRLPKFFNSYSFSVTSFLAFGSSLTAPG